MQRVRGFEMCCYLHVLTYIVLTFTLGLYLPVRLTSFIIINIIVFIPQMMVAKMDLMLPLIMMMMILEED